VRLLALLVDGGLFGGGGRGGLEDVRDGRH
jgi:hypothetical protein